MIKKIKTYAEKLAESSWLRRLGVLLWGSWLRDMLTKEYRVPKPAIWGFLGFGVLFLLVGMGFGGQKILVIGSVLLGAGAFTFFKSVRSLGNAQMLDHWGTMIQGAQSRGQEVFTTTMQLLEESAAPDIEVEKKAMSAHGIGGMLGEERDFLVVKQSKSRLSRYQVLVNVRDYGASLCIDSYIMYTPSFVMTLLAQIPYIDAVPKLLGETDLFEQQDLASFTSTAQSCVTQAVESLMRDLGQDPTEMDKKHGFVGVS